MRVSGERALRLNRVEKWKRWACPQGGAIDTGE